MEHEQRILEPDLILCCELIDGFRSLERILPEPCGNVGAMLVLFVQIVENGVDVPFIDRIAVTFQGYTVALEAF